MNWLHRAIALLAAALGGGTALAADIPLSSGQPLAFSMAANQLASGFYIDVDSNAQILKIELSGQGRNDVDMYVRYGTPFLTLSQNMTLDLLDNYSHYHSISGEDNESIIVTRSGLQPLHAGRWYVALVSYNGATDNLSLKATVSNSTSLDDLTFDFNSPATDCDTSPWNSTAPATPIDGNPGTTVGEQRRNALRYTGQLLTEQLNITVPIVVQACWDAQGGSPSEGATIAHAGPSTFALDSPGFRLPWLPDKYAFYAVTEIVRQGGTRQCGALGGDCSVADIVATFNTDLDPPRNVLNRPFYYGYSGVSKPLRSIDFVSVAMHEITHGLGFLGLVNVDASSGVIGERPTTTSGTAYDDVFSRRVAIVDRTTRAVKPFLGPTTSDGDRAKALVSVDGLRWGDAEAVNSSANVLAALAPPDNLPHLYAPCDAGSDVGNCATQPGSTLSHTDDTTHPDDLMNAFDNGKPLRSLGLARPMLNALGWSGSETVLPTYPQPIPSNWYDRTRNGHGIDFQKIATDTVYGDLYYVVFYTYTTAGAPEYFTALGHITDGRFVALPDANGNTLSRVLYDRTKPAGQRISADASVSGSFGIDFNQAEYSPACRSAGRAGASLLGVMNWSIGAEKGSWCIEPSVPISIRSTPDFAGHWFAGGGDGGWGMEIFSIADGSGAPTIVAELYYPDAQGNPRWATASTADYAAGATIDLNEISNGYCRVGCAAPTQLSVNRIGTLKLTLSQPTRENTPSGANRADVQIPAAGFSRSNVPITLISTPPGG